MLHKPTIVFCAATILFHIFVFATPVSARVVLHMVFHILYAIQ